MKLGLKNKRQEENYGLFEKALVSISKCFYTTHDDKIVKVTALTCNILSNSWVLCLLYFDD